MWPHLQVHVPLLTACCACTVPLIPSTSTTSTVLHSTTYTIRYLRHVPYHHTSGIHGCTPCTPVWCSVVVWYIDAPHTYSTIYGGLIWPSSRVLVRCTPHIGLPDIRYPRPHLRSHLNGTLHWTCYTSSLEVVLHTTPHMQCMQQVYGMPTMVYHRW